MGDWVMSENMKDMTPRLIGETYLRKATETSPQRYRYGLFECQYCGGEFEAQTAHIKSGKTKSCGCQKGDAYGLTSHRFYKTWEGMLQRCNNPKIKAYKNYGGRGIIVCVEWLDVRNFVAWSESTYPNIEGYTLDRIDNDKGYSPDNCRWADATTQAVNQRMQKNNTSGFVGVSWDISKNKWVAHIKVNKVGINLGCFPTKEEAVLARDNYIIENKLPHKLSTDYKKEEKINE